ncbi:hypothetical protein MMC07_001907 [Pseudocyphellaria aurata]|nr:hypothetical protein [Pseudocyphellaria aurata]
MIEKTRGLKVDCIAYDLEDSVTASRKVEARANICDILNEPRPNGVGERAVRINSVGSGLAEDDLNEVLTNSFPDALVVPKVNSGSDLVFVTDMVKHHRSVRDKVKHHPNLSRTSTLAANSQSSPIQILALIESAKAVSNLSSICKATSFLAGLIFAAEDFALDLSLTRTPSLSEFLYARSAIVTECRAHELPSVIDLVCTSYKGSEGMTTLEQECIGGKNLGFNGKQCIHPGQVNITQRAFAPSDEQLTWAVRISIAGRKADVQGRGAWTLDGKMIDAPVMGKAKSLLDRAQACGMDVEAATQKWQGQEPE